MSRKYGRRFREFVGGRVEVVRTKTVKSFYEVVTVAHLAGQSPFQVDFIVADKTGRFIDMRIEGISLVSNYRDQFKEVLSSGGPDELLSRLAAKNASISTRSGG